MVPQQKLPKNITAKCITARQTQGRAKAIGGRDNVRLTRQWQQPGLSLPSEGISKPAEFNSPDQNDLVRREMQEVPQPEERQVMGKTQGGEKEHLAKEGNNMSFDLRSRAVNGVLWA